MEFSQNPMAKDLVDAKWQKFRYLLFILINLVFCKWLPFLKENTKTKLEIALNLLKSLLIALFADGIW